MTDADHARVLRQRLETLAEAIEGMRDDQDNAHRAGLLKGARWQVEDAAETLERFENLTDDGSEMGDEDG